MSKWDILIASSLEREEQRQRLLNKLRSLKKPDMNILCLIDDRKMPLDKKRTQLIQMSDADYVCFVDDDDMVPDDYVETIYPLLEGVDYIGFRLQHYNKGEPSKPTFHSLKYSTWDEDENGYYRNISHLNPIKREIARIFDFHGQFGEDYDWSQRVYKSGMVKTEHFIDKVMYHYYYDADKSLTIGYSNGQPNS